MAGALRAGDHGVDWICSFKKIPVETLLLSDTVLEVRDLVVHKHIGPSLGELAVRWRRTGLRLQLCTTCTRKIIMSGGGRKIILALVRMLRKTLFKATEIKGQFFCSRGERLSSSLNTAKT